MYAIRSYYDLDGYFDSLIAMLHRAIDENFMREQHREIWQVVNHPHDVIPAMEKAKIWDESVRKFAAI